MKTFYLTIDDGPSLDTSTKITFFDRKKIPAIWFCLGENLEKYPEQALQIIKRGDIIANHSSSHPHFSQITFDECCNEIIKTEKIIDALYLQSGTKRSARLFRFPYGDRGHLEELQPFLKKLGFQTGPFSNVAYGEEFKNIPEDLDWLWSYDIREWELLPHISSSTPQIIEENLDRYLQNYDREFDQIILTHDHEETAGYLPRLIQKCLSSGIEFSLPPLLTIPASQF